MESCVLTKDWQRRHLFLQTPDIADRVARMLEIHIPRKDLLAVKDEIAITCRPVCTAATTLSTDVLRGLNVIVCSVYLVCIPNPPLYFPKTYQVITLLHEVAHVFHGHRPPATDEIEQEAYDTAIRWYNRTQPEPLTEEDWAKVKSEGDTFWLRISP